MGRGPNLSGLQWTYRQLPYAAGLDQAADDRARPQPFLDIANDIQFDELGGIQTRFPFVGQVSPTVPDGSIFGGGLLTDVRKLAVNGDELVLFTKDKLFSWNEQQKKWVLRATHLAVSVEEQPRFSTTGDQFNADRAELAGAIVFAWTEGLQVFAAALDKATGSVLVAPTAVPSATGRARLVALATKILLFAEEAAGTLKVRAIDPANPATAIAGAGTTVSTAAHAGLMYDAVRIGTQDAAIGAVRSNANTYIAFTVTAGLSLVTSTKARACDGAIAVSPFPSGAAQTQVIRSNTGGTVIQGDVLTTSSLADLTVNQAIASGTVVLNLTACHRSIATGGAFRCFVFWSDDRPATTNGKSNVTWVDTAGVISSPTSFVNHLAVASRAFDYAGSVYLWMSIAADFPIGFFGGGGVTVEAVQNSYFLFRDDAFLVAKAIAGDGGGFPWSGNNNAIGLLPGISAVTATGFAWCASRRRSFGNATGLTGFAARSPVDVAFEFDTNTARRTAVLGDELYVAAGEILEYDGARLVECGFHVFPWQFQGASASVGGGAMVPGTYTYKETFRYANARGSTERSTTNVIQNVTVTALNNAVTFSSIVALTATHKTATVPAVEMWRTVVNPPVGAPFHLITSKDPTVSSGSNKYLANDPSSGDVSPLTDGLADSAILALEDNPETGGVLEFLAPPGASIIIATDTRLFLGDVDGDPDRVWYSRLRNAGEIASFHDTLTIDVPRIGGRITALGFQDETLFVWRETALYALPGIGFDNLGQGQNFGPARTISLDVGAVNHESVAVTPRGTIFKSQKGWQLLGGDGSLTYIGDKVSDFDSETVLAVNVVAKQHQVRILTSAQMLVWDYRVGQWAVWTVATTNGALVDAVIYDGQQVLLVTQGLVAQGTMTQSTTYTGVNYGMDVETAWIKPDDVQQGAIAARKLQPLGEFRSPCMVRSRIAYNYQQDSSGPNYVDDKVYDPAPDGLVPGREGEPLQFRHSPKRPQCEAFKLRLTAVAPFRQNSSAIFGTDDAFGGAGFDQAIAVIGSSGPVWEASFRADLRAQDDGELGNRLTMTIAIEDGAPFVIDAREDFSWNGSEWVPQVDNLGVRVVCRAGSSPTVAQLEHAIVAASTHFELDTGHPDQTSVIDATAMAGVVTQGQFFGGAFGTPTPPGEAIKLTSLGMELGVEPGLFRRLSATKKI